jgi:hypothetical protein
VPHCSAGKFDFALRPRPHALPSIAALNKSAGRFSTDRPVMSGRRKKF